MFEGKSDGAWLGLDELMVVGDIEGSWLILGATLFDMDGSIDTVGIVLELGSKLSDVDGSKETVGCPVGCNEG